jgi:glycosyltransferase involved in cell wall biosynthesis
MYLPNPVAVGSRYAFIKKQSNLDILYSPDPIDQKRYDFRGGERPVFRKKYGIPEESPVLISVARPSWEKRIDLLIGALAHDKAWRLVFVGEHSSGMGPKWKRYAEKLGVAERIIWTGFLSGQELNEALISADLFALVSESESFGMAVVEAMMCGLPVMISKDVGVWEEIKNEPFTILAERYVDSVVQGMSNFREKMLNSLIDRDYIKQIAVNKFSPQVVAGNLITKLQKLISRDRAILSHLVSPK